MDLNIVNKSNPPILILLVGIFTIIPNTTYGQYLRMAILLFAFIYMIIVKKQTKIDIYTFKLIGLMILSIFISMVSVYLIEHSINMQLVIHELTRLMMNSLILILFFRRKSIYKYVYIVCLINIGTIFFVQLLQSISPVSINQFIRTYYVNADSSAHHLNLALETRGLFRAGAFLINPNICACAVVLCCPHLFKGLKNNKYRLISVISLTIAFLSIILSGSRTGLLIFAIITMIYFFLGELQNKYKILILFIVLISLIFLLFFMNSGFSLSNYRSFDIVGALNQSLFEKIGIFINYFKSANPLYWLTGSLGGYSSNFQTDSEWGYIISYFGIVGLAWYLKLINGIKFSNNDDKVFYLQYQLELILMAFTETIFMCMPVAPLFMVLALSDSKEDDLI